MRAGICAIFLSLIISFPSRAGDTISYSIVVSPMKDRTALTVTMYRKTDSTKVHLQAPTDYYGIGNLSKFVEFLSPLNRTVLQKNDDGSIIAVPDSSGYISVRYRLSFDPKLMDDYSYGPSTSNLHFYIAGCQWMLPENDPEKTYHFKITITAPQTWQLYSSLGASPREMDVDRSYEQMISAGIGGIHRKRFVAYRIAKNEVLVAVSGNFKIRREKISESAYKIIKGSRDFFDDNTKPFFNVSINQRSGIVAGTAIENMFVAFLRFDLSHDDLISLLAHEVAHEWMPNTVRIKVGRGEYAMLYEWIHEGINEYLSRKILFKTGLISEKQMVEKLNTDLINIADNPYADYSYDSLLQLALANKYTTAAKKLSYYRGALIGSFIDKDIIKASGGKRDLQDFWKIVLSEGKKENGIISFNTLDSIGSQLGTKIKNYFELFIVNGSHIYLQASDSITTRPHARFDLGFDLGATQKNKYVTGLRSNSAAYSAGLRNNMKYIGIENSNRFGNGWRKDSPVSVKVEINGKVQTVNYFPRGEIVNVQQLRTDK